MSGRRRWILAGSIAALAVAAGVTTITLADSGSGSGSSTAAGASVTQAHAHTRPDGKHTSSKAKLKRGRSPSYYRRHGLFPKVEPAHIDSNPDPSVVSDVMTRVENAWRASNHNETVIVMAGLARSHKADDLGRFVILRETLRPFRQNSDIIDVPGAAAVRITHGPHGVKAAPRAVKGGNLAFTSEQGISGTLHLNNDSVTLGP